MKVAVEQVNVSDDEYVLVELLVSEEQYVEEGQHICTYESSKAAEEVEAPKSGYVSLNNDTSVGEQYPVGYVLLQINEIYTPLGTVDKSDNNADIDEKRFSKKALMKIQELKISLEVFDELQFVTEADVDVYLKNIGSQSIEIRDFTNFKFSRPFEDIGEKRIAVIGAGFAALQVYDAVYSSTGQRIVKFFDMSSDIDYKTLMGIPVSVVSDLNEIQYCFDKDEFDQIVISFSGNIKARSNLFSELMKMEIPFANIIHRSAEISPFSKIGVGNLIFNGVRIGPFAVVGDNNVFSARCSIEHNNIVGSGNTFGPYVVYSGSCYTGNQNKFGTMISVEPNVSIGNENIIGSNLNLIRNIKNNIIIRSDEKLILKENKK